MTAVPDFTNPFRPGAGHTPPYLAGRDAEKREFARLLDQDAILDNVVLTGLRGIGKTVLLDEFRPLAIDQGWLWVGADLSESASVSEEHLATRLMTDLAAVTAGIAVTRERAPAGFGANTSDRPLDYAALNQMYASAPGLPVDKIKSVIEHVWAALGTGDQPVRGIVFAYDEAQNLSNHAAKDQHPLSLLLDAFQSLQRRGARVMLALVGLPTLFPKLVAARTFAERMFRVLRLTRLTEAESRAAITEPIRGCPVQLGAVLVDKIVRESRGYPYFIQFFCREAYDQALSNVRRTGAVGIADINAIIGKLDTDFFAGRWARVTDRQRDLLFVIANLLTSDEEFTVQEIVGKSSEVLPKAFSSSHAVQMLNALSESGLIYKHRHGKYSFAVPMFGNFVKRTYFVIPRLDDE